MTTSKKKTKQISIRFTEEEYKKIVALASLQHMNPTQYLKFSGLLKVKPIVIKDIERIIELQNENIDLKKENQELKESSISILEAFKEAFKSLEDKSSINPLEFANAFKNALKMKIKDISILNLFLDISDKVLKSRLKKIARY